MKKIVGMLLAVIMLAGLISGCGGEKSYIVTDKNKLPATGETWSVFVYMCGGSLEGVGGNASEALKSMMQVDYTENINVVVETGGTLKWNIPGIDTNYINRFEIQKDGMYLVERAEDEDMAKSTTLTDFLKWGKENYEADHYAVVIWGYGGGSTGGVLYDEKHNNDKMTQDRLAYAIADAQMNFDFVALDSNLMGSLEIASALSLHADYMIASQEIIQGCGWDYGKWLSYLTAHPLSRGDAIGKQICDSYYAKCVEANQEEMATLSVIDLNEISTLTQAFDGLAGRMYETTDKFEEYVKLSPQLNKNLSLGANSPEEGYSNMVDLGSLADNVSVVDTNTAERVHHSLEKAVSYKVNGSCRNDLSGISLFYPTNQDEDEIKAYLQMSTSMNYNDFIRCTCTEVNINDGKDNYKSSWSYACYNNEKDYLKTETKQENDCYELNMTGNMDVVKNIDLQEFYYDDKTQRYLYIGDRIDIEENTAAGIFKHKLSNKILTLNGSYVTMSIVSMGKGYEIYSIPAVINGTQTNIRISYMPDGKGGMEYKVIGVWDGINKENGMSERNIRKLGIIDRIAPVYRIYDSTSTTLSSAFIVGPLGLNIKEKSMENGKYILRYKIKYIYNNEAYTDSANVRIGGSNVSFAG